MRPHRESHNDPAVSFILATFNRRAVLLHTLEQIGRCGLAEGDFEILLVDNASTDGTADAVREAFPRVTVLPQSSNRGPCAKNAALAMARGTWAVFLDDDSYPRAGAIARMIEHFQADPKLAAAVCAVTLPDGSGECSAYPDVCIGCGTGFRMAALREVGGLPDDFFMAAEEYDLSLRLLDGGWRVRRFEDLQVTHLKSSASRFARRVARLDARNNTLLAMRYFPEAWRTRYALEWLERYRLMARAGGWRGPFWAGAAGGMARAVSVEHRPIRPEAFEQFAKIEQTSDRLAAAREALSLRKILLVDLGKNILAYRVAAERRGLAIVGVADRRLGGRGMTFRGIPVLDDPQAAMLEFDAAIVSNLSPIHAPRRAADWRSIVCRPVIDLFADEFAGAGLNTCIASRRAA